MESLTNATIEELATRVQELLTLILSVETLIEIGIIIVLAGVSWITNLTPKAYLQRLAEKYTGYPLLSRVLTISATVSFPLNWLLLQWLANAAAQMLDWRAGVMFVTASLLTAWIVIRVASAFIKNPIVGTTIAILAWTVAALNIVGLLSETITLLDGIGLSVGSARLTMLTLVKGVILLSVLLWLSNVVSEFFESRIKASTNLTPSVQVLFAKLFKIALVISALLVAISAAGVDLTAFAVIGGAIGVGIGFGLQKIVSNLFSGVILLLDKSIKPGDVIAVGDYYGRVDSLGARYVSVTTRDGTEHLIPNEDLIVNRVENWSHTSSLLRLRLPVGVHYRSDVEKARELCLEAASETERVLDQPPPYVLYKGFGDSSVDLEIRYWINDPMNGRANVTSQILQRIWHKFAEHGIEIPYPQRDLHLRTPEWSKVADMFQED